MTLTELKYIVAVAREKHFGKAAEACFVSQPTLSVAIRKLADNLDKRTKEIADGLNKFSGSGLRDYQALATNGQRTLDELNRTVRSLQKNPQQVIFGSKPEIPEYSGK